MNYKTMDYMLNGVIISNIAKSEILYINKVAKKFLKVDKNSEEGVKSVGEFVSASETFEKMKARILDDLSKYEISEGIAYLKALDGTFIEASFCCVWEDKENNIVTYIFKKATEVVGEKQLSFKELAEQLPSGIIVMDIENELAITYANSEHYKILGVEKNPDMIQGREERFLLRDFIFEEDVNWVLSEIFVTIARGEDVDIEFRMKTKNNVAKWVRLFGRASVSATGEKLFYSSLKDLSQRRNIHDKLHMERVLFHKITELTDETIFRLDVQTNIMHFLGKKSDIFGEITVFENYPESILSLYKIHDDDMPIHNDMIECFKKGIQKTIEMRYKLGGEDFEWFRTTYSFIKNSDGEPISVIGKMTNINSQKLLEEQAKTDLLTGFYNKVTTEHEVNKLFSFKNNKSNAFFIIDIDNFKAINDNLGHHFGDIVLRDISDDIRSCFRKNDIFGRIGGDEFVVIMRNVGDTSVILEKANLICGILNKTFSGNDKSYSISASVGISMFPTDGESYEELYKKSDTALYEIKRGGKNGYKQFYNELKITKNSFTPKKLDDNRIKPVLINNTIISTVLNLLYETNDLTTSLKSILKYIGSVFKVDKCYIFETLDDGNTYNDRYRWHKSCMCKEKIQKIGNTNLANIFQDANTDGVFYTNDIYSIKDDDIIKILEFEGVQSIFLLESLKIKNESVILGLEDCTNKRHWSEEEVVTLLHVGRLIFTAVNNHNKISNISSKSKLKCNVENHNSNLEFDVSSEELTNVIHNFFKEETPKKSVINIIKSVLNILRINKMSSFVYHKETDSYVKLYECHISGEVVDNASNLGIKSNQFINSLDYQDDVNRSNFLDLLNEDNYIHTKNYNSVKDIFEKVGFKLCNEDDSNKLEVYAYTKKRNSLFGYMVFEKYIDENLSEVELKLLTSVCEMINSKMERAEIVDKYETDMLMRDVILRNEKVPMAVVEKDTFKILYHNDLYYTIFPNIEVGAICYELLGNSNKCEQCCIDGDLLMNDSNHSEHQWIKKAVPFKLNNGRDVYMIYSKDSMDYVKQLNAMDNLTQSLLLRGFEEYYKNFVIKNTSDYALCTIDIDKFKYINEIFGYTTGDKVLRKVALVIKKFLEPNENFCRMNEDKFSIFIHYEDEIHLRMRLRYLAEAFDEMKKEYFPDVKITIVGGVTMVDKSLTINTLLDQATIARKNAKGSHKNNFGYYNPQIDIKVKEEIQLEERIPQAVANSEFVPFLQPKFDLKTRKICGAEALVRWITPEGMIFPDKFIPLFERNGFIRTLDFIMYDKVMSYIRDCLDRNLPVYPISLNVSRNHIKDKHFVDKFMNLVSKYDIPLKYLELEITESVFVEEKKELVDFIEGIKDCTLKVSIDDFGTAYSSLQNLTEVDVDILKIDKGFLDNVNACSDVVTKDEILIKNIINLAKELDFNVICEGVETDEQIELLKKVGCEYGQGYVFAKPMSINDYEEQFLKK